MPLQNEGVIYLNKEDNEMCNCIASYNTSKTQLHKRWVVGMLRRAPCCWWGGYNETGGGGEWSEGGGCWHTLEHWDMLLGAPLLRHQTQYHPRIMIEMSCSGGRPDETSILTMFPLVNDILLALAIC